MKDAKTRDIDCREALKLIAAYVDQQSNESDRQDLEKHLGETVGGIRRETFRIGEVADRVEGPVDIRRAINQKKSGTIGHKLNKHHIRISK